MGVLYQKYYILLAKKHYILSGGKPAWHLNFNVWGAKIIEGSKDLWAWSCVVTCM
jgi:hypothetical protein